MFLHERIDCWSAYTCLDVTFLDRNKPSLYSPQEIGRGHLEIVCVTLLAKYQLAKESTTKQEHEKTYSELKVVWDFYSCDFSNFNLEFGGSSVLIKHVHGGSTASVESGPIVSVLMTTIEATTLAAQREVTGAIASPTPIDPHSTSYPGGGASK